MRMTIQMGREGRGKGRMKGRWERREKGGGRSRAGTGGERGRGKGRTRQRPAWPEGGWIYKMQELRGQPWLPEEGTVSFGRSARP